VTPNEMAAYFRISWSIAIFGAMCCFANPNRTDPSSDKNSERHSTLNAADIGAAARRLGFTLRWFPALDASHASPASGQQDDLPLSLRRTKFVLHLRERHKWRRYGTPHPVKQHDEFEQSDPKSEFSANFEKLSHEKNHEISTTQNIVDGATLFALYTSKLSIYAIRQ
jgi:hypothetical protein